MRKLRPETVCGAASQFTARTFLAMAHPLVPGMESVSTMAGREGQPFMKLHFDAYVTELTSPRDLGHGPQTAGKM